MLDYLLIPFYNREEGRIRALWRLLLQIALSVLLLLPGAAIAILLFGAAWEIPFEGIPFIQPTPLVEEAVLANPLANMLVLTLTGTAAVLSVWLAGKFFDRRPFADFGLHLTKTWWRDLAAGAVIGAILPTVVFFIEWKMGWVTITDTFYSSLPSVPFAAAFLIPFLFFIGIAVSEEVGVRGYMLTNTAEGLNWKFLRPAIALGLAVLISAFNFGLGHKSAEFSTLNITLAGIWLALGYVLTGELGLPIGLHLTWNLFLGNVFGLPVSGSIFDATSVLVVKESGPVLWTGGSYGPEAGILGTIAFALGILLLLAWIRYTRGRLSFHTSIAEYQSQRQAEAQKKDLNDDPGLAEAAGNREA